MSKAVTLATVLATVRRRADIISMTARHPDPDLIQDINDSWQALREKVSDAGGGFYLVPTAKLAMTPGAAANATGGSIPWPTGAVRIYGIDLYVANNDVRPLRPLSFADRDNFTGQFGQQGGRPLGFYVASLGTEAGATVADGTIYLYPAPDQAYQYVVWYVPAWTDITNTANVFDGVAGWDDWVTWDVVIKVAIRDGDMAQTAQLAMAERDKSWAERILPACRTQRAMPQRRTDVAATNRRQAYGNSWRRW